MSRFGIESPITYCYMLSPLSIVVTTIFFISILTNVCISFLSNFQIKCDFVMQCHAIQLLMTNTYKLYFNCAIKWTSIACYTTNYKILSQRKHRSYFLTILHTFLHACPNHFFFFFAFFTRCRCDCDYNSAN